MTTPSSLEELRESLQKLHETVWGQALDATSEDFRYHDGSLDEKAYLKYQDNSRKLFIEASLTALRSHIEAVILDARINELHLEADRFRESGHKGLPPGFQKRMNELQRAKSYLEGEE